MTYRERLEALIETALAVLDELDGDCDLEHNGDLEPSLGWTRGGGIGNRFDLEDDELYRGEPDHAA